MNILSKFQLSFNGKQEKPKNIGPIQYDKHSFQQEPRKLDGVGPINNRPSTD